MNMELLKGFETLGIILPANLQEQIEEMSRKEVLEKHPYAVYLSNDGRWTTYLPDKDKKRRLVKKKTRTALEDAIVEFYSDSGITFIEAFHKWRGYHDKMVSDSSVTKYDSDEIRYFKDTEFAEMKIEKIRSDDIEVFIRTRIEDLRLCQSAAKTLFHYINSVMEFAVRHDYIVKSPMRFMNAKDFYKYTYQSKRSQKTKIIPETEIASLNNRYSEDLLKGKGAIPILAVIFSSLTGMRVGEIAALTWDDICSDHIIVNKSQKYNPKTKEYYISRTKNGKERMFPLTEDINKLLEEIKSIEAAAGNITRFIFSDDNGPITFRKISSCIKNKCRQIGIETYGIHAYRRTVNSMMAHNGVPVSVRAALLGHSREVNEKYYTFDSSTIGEKADIIRKINSEMR